jgi:iron-sulfur cluster assembly protein
MISLTNKAIHELIRIARDDPNFVQKIIMIRVGVKGGGCSGFSYTLGFEDIVGELDQVFDSGPVRIVCDPKSFLYLNGLEVDFEESLIARGFRFNNPNASKNCGCGESFDVS